eukprot:1369-Heterocapsa_arctica.AAC.1
MTLKRSLKHTAGNKTDILFSKKASVKRQGKMGSILFSKNASRTHKTASQSKTDIKRTLRSRDFGHPPPSTSVVLAATVTRVGA